MSAGTYTEAPTSISTPSRRKAVGDRYPGVYERTDCHGERRLEVDYYDHTGRRRWQVLPPGTSLKAASTARKKLDIRRAEGERFAPTKVPTLTEFFEGWIAERDLQPRTREKYVWAFERHIKPRFGRTKVNAIDSEDIAALARALRRTPPGKTKGLGPASIVAVLSPLSKVLQAAARAKLRVGNPVREFLQDGEHEDRPRVKRPTRKVLTASEVARLVESAPTEHRALVGVLAWAGLRVSEALALQWADIDIDARLIRVDAQLERGIGRRVPLKTERSRREVAMSDDLARVLAAHKLARPKRLKADEAFVFGTRSGRPLDHRAVSRRALDPAAKAAKLPPVSPHSLRHGFGSVLHDAGVPITHISALLGHADESFTYRVYVHRVTDPNTRERMRKSLDAAFASNDRQVEAAVEA
ncbi:MAG: site-specific integrase [Actinomycetota bacterium]|nr:site-specific integrase [Actinomycetota bacterium]